MLCDIGNGTMNVMYINNGKPVPSKCFTEKYGTHQCMLAVRESLMQKFGTAVDDSVIENVLRFGTADIGEKYLSVIRSTATEYVSGIMRRLREHEYNPELMCLYVMGGGSCLVRNFGEYDKGLFYLAMYYVFFVQENGGIKVVIKEVKKDGNNGNKIE